MGSLSNPAPLRVAQVSFFLDPQRRAPDELLQAWPTLVDVARAAGSAGAEVTVVQAHLQGAQLEEGGVRYEFAAPGAALLSTLHGSAPQVVHVHGLGFHAEVEALAAQLPGVPILLQDHADHPPRPWRWLSWRRGLRHAHGFAFCARAQAEAFRRARLLRSAQRVYEIPESTSRFRPGDQVQARAGSGLAGDPCVLWVGHLDANKDPLTVLEGFAAFTQQWPHAQLWCYFGTDPLRASVERAIRADARLGARVHLCGRTAHEGIERAMQAADLFVLGSHREGSGYSLIEALACGLPAAVTDIPSFRALLGTAGTLWRVG
ncbi:MAG TPA: glycosyltransferase family 4 protein, partial [Steroidobacteraceae bacterium]|nr:glycosyltransferase family 4 protein [Steroidobacteraceae bacterium]